MVITPLAIESLVVSGPSVVIHTIARPLFPRPSKSANQRLLPRLEFDSTLGYPGEGPQMIPAALEFCESLGRSLSSRLALGPIVGRLLLGVLGSLFLLMQTVIVSLSGIRLHGLALFGGILRLARL